MNQNLMVLYEDDKYIFISWKKDDISNKYVIVGMDDLFNYNNILRTNKTYAKLRKKDISKYLNIRVDYLLNNADLNRDVFVGSSNTLILVDKPLEKIEIKCLKSYEGFTVSFISDLIYDKYYVYEKVGENYNLIIETEDFQVTSKRLKPNQHYYVEGYKRNDNGYELVGKSNDFVCKAIKITCSNNKKLSIVIPVYNSERFLCRCVDSILLSSFKDFELILVDDGSFDNSPQIIDWYHEKYGDFIKVIHKKNEGVTSARNIGINMASGQYIAFVDNDDFVHPYMYERMCNLAFANDLDVVIGKVIIKGSVGNYKKCLDVSYENGDFLIYDYKKMISEKINNSLKNIYFVAIWNKIIRTSIVKKHPFPIDSYYEDSAFTPTVYSYIDLFGFVLDSYYVWDKRLRKTVGTSTNNYTKKYDTLVLNQKYCDALFYCIYHGNPKRMDYLVYNVIRDAVNYMKKNGILGKNNDVFKIYKNAISRVNEMYDLSKNPYLQVDKELYDFVINIIK